MPRVSVVIPITFLLAGCTPKPEPAPVTSSAPAEEVFHLDSGYLRPGYRVFEWSPYRVSLMAVLKGTRGTGT